jgi:cell division protease FtsH
MNQTVKTVVFWLTIVVSALLLWKVVKSAPEQQRSPDITYSQFMSDVEAGKVASVNITGNRIQGQYRDGKESFRLTGPSNPGVFLDKLKDKGVEIVFKDPSAETLPLQLLGTWAPLILLASLWFFMIRQMRHGTAGGGGTAGVGGSGELR